jgi:hypothetical protein
MTRAERSHVVRELAKGIGASRFPGLVRARRMIQEVAT